jgi:poly(3-hydroxybutyrate) depolymerase
MKKTVLLLALGLALPSLASSQALTSLQSVRVGYNTRKATVKPTGELKGQIDEIDKQIAEASRLGKNAELRRLMAKGTTLLAGRPWTDVLDYTNSVVLRTDHIVSDSTKPYPVRLEQIYSPSIELTRSLTAHVTVRQRPAPVQGGAPPAPGAIVKDLGTFDGVARDLRESPYALELDVHDVPDGTYQLNIEVLDGDRSLGTSTLLINLRKGLDDLVARLEADAKKAPENLRADILFPVDRMRNVNRAKIELRTFDPDKDFADAQAVATAARTGKNPFATKTGDFKRHYLLDTAGALRQAQGAPNERDGGDIFSALRESRGEIMPYRMYVPTSYNGSRAYPLIIALHGLGGTEDAFFENYEKAFPPLAEQHGYIVAGALGYRVDGSYGWGLGTPPADPNARRTQDLSEQDVMRVLELARKNYKIDNTRVYLMGHSMGGIGTWKLAPKYPDIWAAIAPFSGSGAPATLERIKNVPEFVVHGDNDPTVNVQGSRTMVAKMKELGIEVKYLEVPGGNHGSVVAPNFAGMFDFFDAHKKTAKSTAQQ